MGRLESWLMSGGMHGALIFGALLLGLRGGGSIEADGFDWGNGFSCRLGDSDWRVERLDRSPDVILYGALKFEPASVEEFDLLAPSTAREHSCGPADDEFDGCRWTDDQADAESTGYFAQLSTRLLRKHGPGVVDCRCACHARDRFCLSEGPRCCPDRGLFPR